eukprot:15060203-Ditylum_brightwellii.AAC.1
MEGTTKSAIDKQVRKAFALKHSMFTSNRLLFSTPLTEQLRSSPECKHLWLESVQIVVYDFTVVHTRSPSQCAVTDFFQPIEQDRPLQHTHDNMNANNNIDDDNTGYIPALI